MGVRPRQVSVVGSPCKIIPRISRSELPHLVGLELAAGRLSGGAISVIWRREVGMTVHELPVAVNAHDDSHRASWLLTLLSGKR